MDKDKNGLDVGTPYQVLYFGNIFPKGVSLVESLKVVAETLKPIGLIITEIWQNLKNRLHS